MKRAPRMQTRHRRGNRQFHLVIRMCLARALAGGVRKCRVGPITRTWGRSSVALFMVNHNRFAIIQVNQSRIVNTYDPTTLAIDTETSQDS